MTPLPSALIQNFRNLRDKVPGPVWKLIGLKLRDAPGVATGKALADIAATHLNSDQAWGLSQICKNWTFSSWDEVATLFEVIDAWVSSSPRMIDIVWSGPANGTFPIRRIDQVLYDLLSKAEQRIFLVTFAAHRVPLLCEHLSRAIDRGVEVTLLLESEQASAGQLSFDASNAFKDVCLEKVRLLHWPIENRERNHAGKPGKLHVKCAVIDHTAIIGSANLTDDAFNRNMEMGAIIKDPGIVADICKHFRTLEQNSILRRF
ncbi:MAG: DISARM system phospholipase D-like protein DrmC [Verrucomicrobia bacterium]|nr:DISARM system phospholipase D-like protein DrmC [Verrucomicrobiota bacterium]